MEKDNFFSPTANSNIKESGLTVNLMAGEYYILIPRPSRPKYGLAIKAK